MGSRSLLLLSLLFVIIAVNFDVTAVEAFVQPSCVSHNNKKKSTFALWSATSSSSSSPEEILQPVSSEDGDAVGVDFPPPLSKVDRLKRAATFWSTAVPIIFSYYGKYAEITLRSKVEGQCVSDEECQLIWDEQHEEGSKKLAETISSLKGFYVKTAQIIASRQDLFPKQYTEALSGFTDNLDPMPVSIAKAVVEQELLNRDEKFEDVFVEFDEKPLGSASIAQVHRAVLSERYGGGEVAVKIQRPSIESKLLGDIANLKSIAKSLRSIEAMPLDYYTVFSELEKQLTDEFDFVQEAVAMDRIYDALTKYGREPPLVLPRPKRGLVCRRVLVMDFLDGVPLSRAREEMLKKGIDPNGPESKLFGRKLIKSLTDVFGKCILEAGFFHADPHPGNIFVLNDGRIGLIDFGQVKQISGRNRETLAKVMVALADRKSDTNPDDLKKIGDLALELGVEFKPEAKEEAQAAVAMWLFDGSVENLPGGYDKGELSPNSPVKELKSFPQDLVLVGRSSVLIKGLSSRLNIPWSLAREWAPIAKRVLDPTSDLNASLVSSSTDGGEAMKKSIRFSDVLGLLKQWGKGKSERVVLKLPTPIRSRVLKLIVQRQELKEKKMQEEWEAQTSKN